MNRRERRAAVARAKSPASAAPTIVELVAEANRAHQQGRAVEAEVICKQILARAPTHKTTLNLLGVINQAAGRHRQAVKMFAAALAVDDLDSACHYNIATSYQALEQGAAAAAHFKKAIALGFSGDKEVEEFVMQNPVVVDCVRRMMTGRTPLPGGNDELFSSRDI